MNILDLLREDHITFRKVADTYGDEYASPCPHCGGNDRFRSWPNRKGIGGWFWCRQCSTTGDGVRYLKAFHNLSLGDAFQHMGYDNMDITKDQHTYEERTTWTPQTKTLPPMLWQEKARILVELTEKELWKPEYSKVQQFLLARGLTEKTLRENRIGYLPKELKARREVWGLEPAWYGNGTIKQLIIPEGIVIPDFEDSVVSRIKIRKLNTSSKYHIVSGSCVMPFRSGGNAKNIIVVESELDALLLNQEAGHLVTAIALGSVYVRPDLHTHDLITQASVVLIALDDDKAGITETFRWWLQHYPKAKPWPVLRGKDPTEAFQKGLDIKDWITAGINGAGGRKTIIEEVSAPVISISHASEDYLCIRQNLGAMLDAHILPSEPIAVDVKTSGPDPLVDAIEIIALAQRNQIPLLIEVNALSIEDTASLRQFLGNSQEKVMSDGKRILKFLAAHGVDAGAPFFDIALAEEILTSGLEKSESRSIESNSTFNGEFKMMAERIKALLPKTEELKRRLTEEGLSRTATLEFDALPAVAAMELNGMNIDLDRCASIYAVKEQQRQGTEQLLKTALGPVNLNSRKELLQALVAKGLAVADTKKETLLEFMHAFPFIKDLLTYRSLQAVIHTHLRKYPAIVHPKTRRIHPTFNQIGAPTGRFSCHNPSMQNVPKDKDIRKCFTAGIGFKLVVGDYSQIELRIAAELSQDGRMTEAFRAGEDLHNLTASILQKKDIGEVTKEERQAAKAVNFGLLYGMGCKGLQASALVDYGIQLSPEEAKNYIQQFLGTYQGFAGWKTTIEGSNTCESRTVNGRRRLWKNKPVVTEALNTPIQGTAADILKRALAMLHISLKGTGAKMVGTVHDDIIIEAPEEGAEKVAEMLKDVMEAAGKEFLKNVPVVAEVRIGDDWAE